MAGQSETGASRVLTEDDAKQLWRRADCVSFDVDSTVIKEEGIDDLARFVGVGEEVSKMTRVAMQGGESYRTSLRRRLEIIRPSRSILHEFVSTHPPTLTPGIERLVTALQSRGVAVYLVSGGFTSIIEPVAERLGIPREHVYANQLLFNDDGTYRGFDETRWTSDDHGKARVLDQLRRERGYRVMVHVGDGATDAEASPPADLFVGFGGNVVREDVKRQAAWFITNFVELTQLLTDESTKQQKQ